jgi:hypothetical protein
MGSTTSHSYEPQFLGGEHHNRTDYTTHDTSSCSEYNGYTHG